MIAYSINRPVSIGTYPTGEHIEVKQIVNFEAKRYIPEIDKEAWGYVDFQSPAMLPKVALDAYGLIAQEYLIIETWDVLCKGHELSRKHEKGPAETVKYVIKKRGKRHVLNCLYAYIKIRPSEGRISRDNRDYLLRSGYADNNLAEWNENPVIRMGLDNIHPTHIDQIISELRKGDD